MSYLDKTSTLTLPQVEIQESLLYHPRRNFNIEIKSWYSSQVFQVYLIQKLGAHSHYYSWISCQTDEKGDFNLRKYVPMGGSYQSEDALGLFWSAQSYDQISDIPLTFESPLVSNMEVNQMIFLICVGDQVLWSSVFQEDLLDKHVQKWKLHHPALEGHIYWPKGKVEKMVLFLGGSEGGIWFSDYMGKLISSEGIGAISLAYFGMGNLPKELKNIPIEYFMDAIEHISHLPELQDVPLVLAAYSKGAEIALEIANRSKKLAGLVLWAPAAYVFQGITQAGEACSSWSENGKPLPYIPLDFSGMGRGKNLLHIHKEAIEKIEDIGPYRIPTDRIACPVMLFSGKEDLLWPSSHMAEVIELQLSTEETHHPVYHVQFPEAGHLICGKSNEAFQVWLDGSPFALGGTAKSSSHAARSSFNIFLDFVNIV